MLLVYLRLCSSFYLYLPFPFNMCVFNSLALNIECNWFVTLLQIRNFHSIWKRHMRGKIADGKKGRLRGREREQESLHAFYYVQFHHSTHLVCFLVFCCCYWCSFAWYCWCAFGIFIFSRIDTWWFPSCVYYIDDRSKVECAQKCNWIWSIHTQHIYFP